MVFLSYAAVVVALGVKEEPNGDGKTIWGIKVYKYRSEYNMTKMNFGLYCMVTFPAYLSWCCY